MAFWLASEKGNVIAYRRVKTRTRAILHVRLKYTAAPVAYVAVAAAAVWRGWETVEREQAKSTPFQSPDRRVQWSARPSPEWHAQPRA